MNWTAPENGTGPVGFWAAFNAADGTGGTGGDVIYLDAVFIEESTVGIGHLAEAAINIYPNPATDYFIVENAVDAEMKLYDMNGRLVISHTISEIDENIDVSKLGSGIYFVTLSADNDEVSKKLMIR
jgi:hypothetical protein